MFRKSVLALATVVAIGMPGSASGQVGIGARVGTLGIGGEVSVGVGSRLGIRGGIGFLPSDLEKTLDGIDYTLNPPSPIWNVGVDIYPTGGGLRLSAGILNRKHFDLSAFETGTAEVGGQTYTGSLTLQGTLTNENETAPYVAVGYGKTFAGGIGLFVDLGAAPMGEADIELTGTCRLNGNTQDCPSQNGQTFQQSLDAEEIRAEEAAGGYLKWHPILQIVLKLGFGGGPRT